jgi:spore maturation protein SpmA
MPLAKFGTMVLQTNGLFTEPTEASIMATLADQCGLLEGLTSTLKPNIKKLLKDTP